MAKADDKGRSDGGKFRKGVSGNPTGRPKTSVKFQELVREFAPRALEVMLDLMEHSDDDRVRLAAAQEIQNRSHGKPSAQAMTPEQAERLAVLQGEKLSAEVALLKAQVARETSGETREPIEIVVREYREDEKP